MIVPAYLKEGDKVAIVSTAKKLTKEEILPAIEMIRSWGFEVQEGKNLYKASHQFAGTDEQRLSDLQEALDDASVKAVICARGGYGTVRILDKVDFSVFAKKPKWIVGYSDITALHSHIHTNYEIETIHAVMPIHFPKNQIPDRATESLREALFGELKEYNFNSHPLNCAGEGTGLLTGGNLSMLYSLTGTNSDIETDGKILFLEDLDEYLYHVDRMMMNLKKAGKLQNLAGLIVGGMTKMNDNEVPFGKTAEEIIRESVDEFNYPVCFGFPAGHIEENCALYMGRKVQLKIDKNCRLLFVES